VNASAGAADEPEIPLTGGTVSTPVRVGDTVRRPLERWSPAVHDLLRHLERVGFDAAPKLLGIDDRRREVLTWIEGTPATRPWPIELRADAGLAALGRLLRRFHDAVASYQPAPDAEWFIGRRPLRPGELVCHGDLGPWNVLWRGGGPVALLDWDFAEPALPVRDLGQLAFFVVPMRDDAHCVECGFDTAPDRAHRLRVLCDAYGHDDTDEVVDAAEAFWVEDRERTATLGPRGIPPWDGFLRRGLLAVDDELLAWLRTNRSRLR
jgi:aminoglycoside phosphotransferase (APT) family kinase protein